MKKSQPIEQTAEVTDSTDVSSSISVIGTEFGRDDINELRDKLNEVIMYLNGN